MPAPRGALDSSRVLGEIALESGELVP